MRMRRLSQKLMQRKLLSVCHFYGRAFRMFHKVLRYYDQKGINGKEAEEECSEAVLNLCFYCGTKPHTNYGVLRIPTLS
jgi:hypothetical protein